MADITKLAEDVMEYSKEKQNWIVLQLHSSLSIAEQDKVRIFDVVMPEILIIQ